MSSVDYWKSVIDSLKGTEPKKENYYNSEYESQISKAKDNIGNLVSEQDKYSSEKNSAEDTYNTFQGSMKSYSELYKTGYDEFGVKQYQDQYEKSKQALAQAQASLSALPSQITAGSNVVLTKSQKEAMYNKLSDIRMKNIDTMEAGTQKQMDAWELAREGAQNQAYEATSQQQAQLSNYNQVWVNAMDKYNTAGKNILNARYELSNWESMYSNWKYQAWSADTQAWLTKYETAVKNYSAAINADIIRRNADLQASLANSRNARKQELQGKLADALVNYKYYSENVGRTTFDGKKISQSSANYYMNLVNIYKNQLASY